MCGMHEGCGMYVDGCTLCGMRDVCVCLGFTPFDMCEQSRGRSGAVACVRSRAGGGGRSHPVACVRSREAPALNP
eukprot:5708-Chlamydomonas_euryale.AAC.1